MKVFILCGGYGTRLDYEGKNIPKALIKIGRKPILFHLIKIFLKYNFTEFVLCLGYKKNLIEFCWEWLNSTYVSYNIRTDLYTNRLINGLTKEHIDL